MQLKKWMFLTCFLMLEYKSILLANRIFCQTLYELKILSIEIPMCNSSPNLNHENPILIMT